jgi:serpin B
MLRALHVDPAKSADSHASFGKLLLALNRGGGSNDGVILTVADRLWGQKDLAFNEEFLALLRDRYHAPLEPVDFVGAPQAALAAINNWASTQTHGRIPQILGGDAVGPSTRLILTNAVYFLGNWVKPFHPDTTREGDFTGVKGPVKVKIMHQKDTFAHAREGDAQIVELPYKGNLSMLVVLPDTAAGLPAVEKRMGEKYDAWVAALRPKEVELELPRWTFTSDLSLVKPLGQLGMRRAFHGDADFLGIAAGGGLAINEVIQKAFIEVNETGTEAAAVTALGVYSLALGPPPPQPVIFHADHPFLYFIRDTTTGAILFIGRVVDR